MEKETTSEFGGRVQNSHSHRCRAGNCKIIRVVKYFCKNDARVDWCIVCIYNVIAYAKFLPGLIIWLHARLRVFGMTAIDFVLGCFHFYWNSYFAVYRKQWKSDWKQSLQIYSELWAFTFCLAATTQRQQQQVDTLPAFIFPFLNLLYQLSSFILRCVCLSWIPWLRAY